MKKAILSAALALVMLLSIFPATAFAEGLAENDKFYFGVTSADTTVSMKVGSDYKAVFTLPTDENATVNTDSMTIKIAMQNVTSLGVGEKREHTITVETGLGNNPVELGKHLGSAYGFKGSKIVATIDGKECTYEFGAYDDTTGTITAKTDTDAARAAWHALTDNVEPSTQNVNDSYIKIVKGSSVKIGTEYLRFEDDAGNLVLNDFSQLGKLNDTIRQAVYLDTCEEKAGTIEICIKAGTTLAVGQSVAKLKNDCTITISTNPEELKALDGVLAKLRDITEPKMMVKGLVEAFNSVVGVVDAADSVNVDFVFDKDEPVTPPTPSRPSSGGSYTVVTKDMPLVYSGSRGEDVKTLQAQLNALGYDCGDVDGIFGAKTYNAVVKFQKDRGLAVDGIVGKNTWAALGVTGTTVVETQTTAITSSMPLLRRGSTGEAVKTLQTRLNALGYDCGTVDGIFGIKTYNAVVSFQTARALAVDGIVGVNTWGALA